MPLTDTRLRALKPKDKPYKVTDERGLYVEVTPTGGKERHVGHRRILISRGDRLTG